DLDDFRTHLFRSKRVLALVGAGLSASSRLPTFRDAGGLWRRHRAKDLASPYTFKKDPVSVWLFYSERRSQALQARPNAAHYALAELGKRHEDFLMISQNVDDLYQRAGHPESRIKNVHGSIFNIRCTTCSFVDIRNF
ncbi:DHS-like NAD/FAD-binding domain-containing protein, partial [Tothia fuscella]